MLGAVRNANVVVTNPTHIAVALQYEHGVTDLPVVVAKGEGAFAEEIRRVAEEAGVPILQNVPLARGLNEKIELDDYIGNEFFEAVAEVLHVKQNTYSQYEIGVLNYPLDVVIRLAKYYGVSVDYLVGLTNETTPYSRRQREK